MPENPGQQMQGGQYNPKANMQANMRTSMGQYTQGPTSGGFGSFEQPKLPSQNQGQLNLQPFGKAFGGMNEMMQARNAGLPSGSSSADFQKLKDQQFQQTGQSYLDQGQSTPYQFNKTAYQQPERTGTATGYNPTQYQQFQYQAPQLMDRVSGAYDQMMRGAQSSGLQGIKAGLAQGASEFGRRGIQGSGLADTGLAQRTAAGANQMAQTMGQLALQKAQGLGQLEQAQAGLNQWQQAQQAGEGQFGATLGNQQAQFGANLAEQQYNQNQQLAELDRQMDLQEWQTGRQIDQNERQLRRQELLQQFQTDQAIRQEQMQQMYMPLQLLMQMYPGMISGQTQAGQTGGIIPGLGALAGGAGMAAAGFSDRRLKKNIKKVGVRDDGLNVYEFEYTFEPGKKFGVMADEVEKIYPEAVGTHDTGFKYVDYSKI